MPNVTTNILQLHNIHVMADTRGGARLQYPADLEDWERKDITNWLPRASGNPGMVTAAFLCEGRVQQPGFDWQTAESLDFQFTVPKSYALNTNVYFAVDWCPRADDGGKVRWGLNLASFDHSADGSRLRFNGEYSWTFDHRDSKTSEIPGRFKTVWFGPYTGFDRARMTVIGRIYRDVDVDTPMENDAILCGFCMYHKNRSLGTEARTTDE